MSHEELRRYILEELPVVERKNELHILTKREVDKAFRMLRYAYRNVAYLGPGYELLPQYGLAAAAEIMWKHRDRGDGWRHVSPSYHLNHALAHLEKHKAGDKSEPHAKHACTRGLMLAELLALANECDAVD